jgi:hypothetical protein
MKTSLLRLLVIGLLFATVVAIPAQTQQAGASATSVMSELVRIPVPGTGEVRGAAATPDDSAVFVGTSKTISKISTASNTVVDSRLLPLPGLARITDIAVSSDGTKVFVVSWLNTPNTRIDILSASTLATLATFDHNLDALRVDVPRDDSDHFVVTGNNGWLRVKQNTPHTFNYVVNVEKVKQGTVSHDGLRVYGQRMNTVSNDAAFGFTITGTPLNSGFVYGDGGGGMHYTTVDDTIPVDRVLLFVGDSALGQNAYVLDTNGNHKQTLNIKGLTYGTEGVDEETVIATQNLGTSPSQNSGLSVLKLIKHPGTGWALGQRLILDEHDDGDRYAGDIITTPSLNRYYVNNVLGGEVIVVADGPQNQPPDCSTAAPSVASIWPPNHSMHDVSVLGVTDPDNNPTTINIDAIHQDEVVNGKGDGSTGPDGSGVGTDTASIRAERSGKGDGRVYEIAFTADDGNGGSCSATVSVTVPKNQGKKGAAINSGTIYDSTVAP